MYGVYTRHRDPVNIIQNRIQNIPQQLLLCRGGKTEQKALSIVMVAVFDVMTTFCALFSNL